MTTESGPVISRENNTAGTPTSTVSGSASPRARPDRDEVAADLGVDREQRRQRVLRRDVTRPRCARRGARRRSGRSRRLGRAPATGSGSRRRCEITSSPSRFDGKRCDPVRERVADTGLADDADDHGDERHERQDVADDRVDGVAAGLVEVPTTPPTALPMRTSRLLNESNPDRFGGAGSWTWWRSCPCLLGLGRAVTARHHAGGDELGDDAADQDHDQADEQVADGKVTEPEARAW